MGAWGTGTFENDDAMDWALELAASPEIATVAAALDAVASSSTHLEAPVCSVAVAAAETVAALEGHPGRDLPEEVLALTKSDLRVGAPLIARAKEALAKVLDDSELRELWETSDDFEGWRLGLADLQRRLEGVA